MAALNNQSINQSIPQAKQTNQATKPTNQAKTVSAKRHFGTDENIDAFQFSNGRQRK